MNPAHSRRSIQPPAVAGSFYPSDPAQLRASITGMLDGVSPPHSKLELKMLIVPHAGYVYSGPVAATAYRLLQSAAPPRQLVVVGPSHFVAFTGLATSGVEGLATPLGVVPVDADLTTVAEGSAGVGPNRAAHSREHSVEVQLPFLQVVLDQLSVLTLLTGTVEPEKAAEVLDKLIEVGDVVVLISTDLSHYLDYDTARERDQRTARSIVDERFEDLAWGDACGLTGLQAALVVAEHRGWECGLLDLRSSGDTAGGRDSVVGYGSFVIGPVR